MNAQFKRLFLVLLLLVPLSLFGQITDYVFTAGTEPYTSLTTGTPVVLSGGNMNDGYATSVPIGFDFWFMGVRYNNVGISTNGCMVLGALSTSLPGNNFTLATSTSHRPLIGPLWDDLDFSQSLGQIRYLTSGTAPNRIFTVEWDQVEWGWNANDSVISFQARLHETTGKITFLYRQESGAVFSGSASIGIGDATTSFRSLDGTGAAPLAGTTLSTNNLNTRPASNQAYHFTPPVLPAPSNATYTNITLTSLTLNWTDNSTSEMGFIIYISTDGVNYSLLTQKAANITAHNITGLLTGTQYHFRVYTLSEGAISAALSTSSSTLNGTMSGVYTIPGNYTSIKAALQAIQTNGAGAHIILELQSNYTGAGETYPINIPNFGNPPDKTITLRPAAGVTNVTITGNPGAIRFNGTKHFIIDGRPGGAGTTRALKMHCITPTQVNAVIFENDACNDTIRYCDIQTSATDGIFIGGTTGITGNDNNSIEYNYIHGNATSAITTRLFYAAGNSGKLNEGNTLAYNHFFDVFPPTNTADNTMINISSGNNDYRIIGNHVYQTQPLTSYTSTYVMTIISASMEKISIINNYIGGSGPLCSGNPWELGPISNNNRIRGIILTSTGSGLLEIRNNTIANFLLATNGTSPASGIFEAINVQGKCGIIANTIGSSLGNNSITIVGGSTCHTKGIVSNNNPDSVKGNMIGSFHLSSIAPSAGMNFTAIEGTGTTPVYVDSNVVGSTVTPHSIFSSSSTTVAQGVGGIGLNVTNNKAIASNNIIANLTNASSASGSSVGGIHVAAQEIEITGNHISVLKSAAPEWLTGIYCNANVTNTSAKIIANRVHSLELTSLNGGGTLIGLYLGISSLGQFEISRNFIHTFTLQPTNTTARIWGVYSNGSMSAPINVHNNMIRMGVNPDGSSLTAPVDIRGIFLTSGGTKSILHNSIYIGGQDVLNGTGNSTCLYASYEAGTVNYNNIYTTARQNATTGGTHFLTYYTSFGTMNSIDNNIYYTYGMPFRIYKAPTTHNSFSAYRTTVPEPNSGEVAPRFINQTGNAPWVDLHIMPGTPTPVEANGNSTYTLWGDYDNEWRGILGPVDIGADASSFVYASIPVKWIGFSGKYINDKQVQLNWRTASEENNSHFEVERSFDGRTFEFAGKVRGNGTTTVLSSYLFTDKPGTSTQVYYRLKQVDFNGKFNYSSVISVEKSGTETPVSVFPNPFDAYLEIDPGNYSLEGAVITIADAFGKVVYRGAPELNGTSGRIDTRGFAHGIYFAKVVTGSGKTYWIKVIK